MQRLVSLLLLGPVGGCPLLLRPQCGAAALGSHALAIRSWCGAAALGSHALAIGSWCGAAALGSHTLGLKTKGKPKGSQREGARLRGVSKAKGKPKGVHAPRPLMAHMLCVEPCNSMHARV